MHEILNSCKEKPNPNFNKNSSILKNPKIFQKPQNLGFKTWNACKWEIRNIPSEEKKTWESLKNAWKEVWSERECFGRWKDGFVEREIEKSEREIALNLYIEGQ